MAVKRASDKPKAERVFGQIRKPAKMFRAGLYARVSTNDQQTIPLQIRALREYAARRGWTIALQVKEIGSGASQRQLRERLLQAARRQEIDVVLVWRLDRLGRNLKHLITLLEDLQALGIAFVSLAEGIDATTPAGKLQMHILGAIAEFERARIAERVKAGLRRARAQGKRLGRPRKVRPGIVVPGGSVRSAARVWGVSRSTAARWINTGRLLTSSLPDKHTAGPIQVR